MKLKAVIYTRGIGIVETLVGLSILVSAVLVLMAAFNNYINIAIRETNVLTATYLAEEGVEATRSIRDAGFAADIATQTTGTPYHIVFNGTDWDFTATPQIIDGKFTRTVTLDDVYRRDSDSDIVDVSSGDPKTLDPETKKVTVVVSYEGGESRTIVTYLTDLFDN
jgi:Tfp pilus assembly protein PilW